jgi:hypothetical protein
MDTPTITLSRRDLAGSDLKPDVVVRLQAQFVAAVMRGDVFAELDALARLKAGTVASCRSETVQVRS